MLVNLDDCISVNPEEIISLSTREKSILIRFKNREGEITISLSSKEPKATLTQWTKKINDALKPPPYWSSPSPSPYWGGLTVPCPGTNPPNQTLIVGENKTKKEEFHDTNFSFLNENGGKNG